MIIVRCPYRVSYVGGGTDYRSFYERHGGACLTSTLDYYCHVLLKQAPGFQPTRYRVQWAKTEQVDSVSAIEHPGVRGCLTYLDMDEPLEIIHVGDLPARSGLGSSSAFVVGLLHALRVFRDEDCSRASLARDAMAVEQAVLQETVGIQDQIECAWGGLNLIEIRPTGHYTVSPVEATWEVAQRFEGSFLLLYTGLQRYASDIAAVQVDNVKRREAELLALRDMVEPAAAAFVAGDVPGFGSLLDEAWNLKRRLADAVSSQEIDAMYAKARSLGAWGGKVLGAGGGGFLLLCAPPETHERIREALGLLHIPFRFSHGGSEVVHVS